MLDTRIDKLADSGADEKIFSDGSRTSFAGKPVLPDWRFVHPSLKALNPPTCRS